MGGTQKQKEPEINSMDDVRKLPENERARWEVANELGLFDKVIHNGWRSLTAKESGRIGGIIASKKRHKK